MSGILFRRARAGTATNLCPQFLGQASRRVNSTNYLTERQYCPAVKRCEFGPTINVVASHNVRQMPCFSVRNSSSDVYQLNRDFRLHDMNSAKELVDHFEPAERARLLTILLEQRDIPLPPRSKSGVIRPTFAQLRHVFIINTIPFIGFGILDNMIMLLAGEYIDQTLGALLGISTMAAAALGNIISDVAGVGLAHYVEKMVSKLGFSNPDLTPKQLEMKRVRSIVNGARAFGLVVGCVIGMFPLLFFKTSNNDSSTISIGVDAKQK